VRGYSATKLDASAATLPKTLLFQFGEKYDDTSAGNIFTENTATAQAALFRNPPNTS
jgi:hypothetical protein